MNQIYVELIDNYKNLCESKDEIIRVQREQIITLCDLVIKVYNDPITLDERMLHAINKIRNAEYLQ